MTLNQKLFYLALLTQLYILNGILNNNILGVIFDFHVVCEQQMTKTVQFCFVHLRNINKITAFLSHSDLEKTIYAVIFSCLDYCNTIYF